MNTNDVLYKIAARAKTLGNMTMDQLRLMGGYGCETANQSREMHKGKTRGDLIEFNLVEEFHEEFPKDIQED